MKLKLIIALTKFGYLTGMGWIRSLAWSYAVHLMGVDDACDMLHPEFGWMWRE